MSLPNRRLTLPQLDGQPFRSNRLSNGIRGPFLTVHDPTAHDVAKLSSLLGEQLVMSVEVAVDFAPGLGLAGEGRQTVLEQTYHALSSRFRPEHHALWDYGSRGAVQGRGMPVQPLERRRARLGEEIIYGRRHDFMQAKLYHKTLDQDVILSLPEQKIRVEVTLRRWGCYCFGINHLSDLLGYPFRRRFAGHFRIIDHPEVRLLRGLDGTEYTRRLRRMEWAWNLAGVAKFAVGSRPRMEQIDAFLKLVRARERIQLPSDHYKLVCDQAVHAKIGSALMNLQRRFQPKEVEKNSCS